MIILYKAINKHIAPQVKTSIQLSPPTNPCSFRLVPTESSEKMTRIKTLTFII